jgi:catechol 2,3-dioxygenase-like lactoylglutathione lyase family enzyme
VRLDHVQVAAPPGCEEAARRFYGELLGMVEVRKPDALAARGGVWFEELHVGVEDAFVPALKAHPALRVDSLDAVAARLAAAGCMVLWDHAVVGVRRVYTADPWGNRVELLEGPASTAAG